MMNLTPFKFNNNEIRVIQDDNHEPWFIATDVAKILGHNRATDMIKYLDDDEKGVINNPTLGGNQDLSIINESGLYSCILKSRKEGARPFKKWVTKDVLPSIRKHGMYAMDELLENPDLAINALQRLKEERELRIQAEQKAQHAIKTKAWINGKQTATALATASKEKRRAERLEIELDKSKDYATVKRMQMIYHGQTFNWRELKSVSKELGLPPIDVFDANYGTVKSYHRDVWMETYALDF